MLLLGLLTAYSNHFTNPFQYDDIYSIEQNTAIRTLAHPARFFTDARTLTSEARNSQYRPLAALSFALDVAWGGLDPRPFHVTSFLWHVLAVGLLWGLLRRLLDPAGTDAEASRWALAGAALFAFHPIATEPLNHLTLRSEMMAAAGLFATPWLWLAAPRWRRTGVWLLPMLVGSLAKPVALVAAPLLLLVLWLVDDPRRSGRRGAAWAAGLAFGLGAAMFLFTDRMNGADSVYGNQARLDYLRTQTFVWLDYLRVALLPFGLSIGRAVTPVTHWWDTRALAGLATATAMLWGAWRLRRRGEPEGALALLGVLWFFAALAPSSSIFPLPLNAFEYRLYPALPGLIVAALALAHRAVRRGRVDARRLGGLWAALIVLFALLSYRRNTDWRSPLSIWLDAATKNPLSAVNWSGLGYAYQRTGNNPAAIDAWREAVRLSPGLATAQINLAIQETMSGEYASAQSRLDGVLKQAPRDGQALSALAFLEVSRGDHPRAADLLLQLLRMSPDDAQARARLLGLLDQLPGLVDSRCARVRVLMEVAPGPDLAARERQWCAAPAPAPAPPITPPARRPAATAPPG